jgi:NADH:ubiquinone oxidoreductase subunit H
MNIGAYLAVTIAMLAHYVVVRIGWDYDNTRAQLGAIVTGISLLALFTGNKK